MPEKNSVVNPSPVFMGEVMLAGWRDSHNNGATVSFWLPDPSDLDVFRGMTVRKGNTAGQRFMAVLVEIHDGEELDLTGLAVEAARTSVASGDVAPVSSGKSSGAYSTYSSALYRNGFYHFEVVLKAIGSVEEYRRWCETQPSVISNENPPSVYFNPLSGDYLGVPVSAAEQELMNNSGQVFGEIKREHTACLSRWMAQIVFKEPSMSHVAPERLLRWAKVKNVAHYLPLIYRKTEQG